MYQNHQQAGANIPTPKEVTATENVVTRFKGLCDSQEKLIISIGEKLHSIYNQRNDLIDTRDGSVKPMEMDFLSTLHSELQRVENSNDKLQKILSHLNQIV